MEGLDERQKDKSERTTNVRLSSLQVLAFASHHRPVVAFPTISLLCVLLCTKVQSERQDASIPYWTILSHAPDDESPVCPTQTRIKRR